MKNRKLASIGWLLGAVTLAAFACTASATETNPAPNGAQDNAAMDSGVRVYIDPATGKLRQATPAERAEEARQSAEAAKLRKGKGVKYSKRADGAVRALDLEGRLMESVVVTTNPDGSLSYAYVTGDASQVQPIAPAATLEEK